MKDAHQLIEYCCNEIDRIVHLVQSKCETLPSDHLVQKHGSSWSIADNLKHLMVVNASYYPIFDALLAGKVPARSNFLLRLWGRWMGGFILKSVSRTRAKKISTFPIWEPGAWGEDGQVLPAFYREQERLKVYFRSSLPLLEQEVYISSPANRNIRYSLQDAFRIIVEHEWRHLHQAFGESN